MDCVAIEKETLQSDVVGQIHASICVKQALIDQVGTLYTIAVEMVTAFRHGKKVLLFGNGGSATDAEHIACELAGKFLLARRGLAAVALTTNTAVLTSIGNDFGYDEVFRRQIEGIVVPGDVVIGISTSGESRNVIEGILEAGRRGAVTVAFSGQNGVLKDITRHALAVASSETPRIQEAHITAGHAICYMVEQMLFGGDSLRTVD